MSRHKKVTLYVPCYNAEKYIAECLEGILKQTYPIDEILVIDDGSTDRTVEIASKYPVKIISHGINKGLAAARNTAFRNAKNEYVAALDADCVPEPDWLEKLMENFTDENIAGVGGKLIEKYTDTLADKWRAVHMRQHWGDVKIIDPPFLLGCNNVFFKKILLKMGLYDEKLRTNAEDADISGKIYRAGFTLIYEPSAIVEHLRRDSLLSVLETFWRHHYAARLPIGNLFRLIYKIGENGLRSSKLAIEDISKWRFKLVSIDLLLFFYHTKIDIKKYLLKK